MLLVFLPVAKLLTDPGTVFEPESVRLLQTFGLGAVRSNSRIDICFGDAWYGNTVVRRGSRSGFAKQETGFFTASRHAQRIFFIHNLCLVTRSRVP